jgi:hypothetical protein
MIMWMDELRVRQAELKSRKILASSRAGFDVEENLVEVPDQHTIVGGPLGLVRQGDARALLEQLMASDARRTEEGSGGAAVPASQPSTSAALEQQRHELEELRQEHSKLRQHLAMREKEVPRRPPATAVGLRLDASSGPACSGLSAQGKHQAEALVLLQADLTDRAREVRLLPLPLLLAPNTHSHSHTRSPPLILTHTHSRTLPSVDGNGWPRRSWS